MKTKLIIPVIDTERGKFEYGGRSLTREEYEEMEYDQFRRTNSQVGRFVDNMRRGISNINPSGVRNVSNVSHPGLIFNDEEAEVIVSNAKMQEVEENYLVEHGSKHDMFILILNINTDTISADAESEMRYWMRDSDKLINDKSVTEDVKLKALQGRDFGIRLSNGILSIRNCKMVQNFSTKKNQLKFAIIIEKSFIQNG